MQPQPRIHDKVGYCLVETLICNKLSERAEGKLHYQIWQHQGKRPLNTPYEFIL